MADTGYDLSKTFYNYRYFLPDADPARLLKKVRNFVKTEGVETTTITINNSWSDEQDSIVFEATVAYMEADTNA